MSLPFGNVLSPLKTQSVGSFIMPYHNILWFLDIFRPDSLCEPDILPQLLAWISGWYSLQDPHVFF